MRLLRFFSFNFLNAEISGSLSVDAQARYKAEAEELRQLDLHELEDLARKSEQLLADAIARSRTRRQPTLACEMPALPGGDVGDERNSRDGFLDRPEGSDVSPD